MMMVWVLGCLGDKGHLACFGDLEKVPKKLKGRSVTLDKISTGVVNTCIIVPSLSFCVHLTLAGPLLGAERAGPGDV